MKPSMRLAEAAEWYIRVRSQKSQHSQGCYRIVSASLSEHLDREATVRDLTRATVGSWVSGLLDAKTQLTVKRYATTLVSLWKWCASVGLADEPKFLVKDLIECPLYVPKRTLDKPTHRRRSEEELMSWLNGASAPLVRDHEQRGCNA